MSLTVFIIDDEGPVRRELGHHLGAMEDVAVVGEAASASQALPGLRALLPDLVFLDIQMPGLSGLELSYLFDSLEKKPLFVFVTAYEEHAVTAFELDALDYILKPFTAARVARAVDKARRMLRLDTMSPAHPVAMPSQGGAVATGLPGEAIASPRSAGARPDGPVEPDRVDLDPGDTSSDPHPTGRAGTPVVAPASERRIPLFDGERIVPTSPRHIFHVTSEAGRITVHAVHGVYAAKSTIAELEERLAPHGFFRAHRSHLVNLNHVAEIVPWTGGSYKLVMSDKARSEIVVSRYNARDLKAHFDL